MPLFGGCRMAKLLARFGAAIALLGFAVSSHAVTYDSAMALCRQQMVITQKNNCGVDGQWQCLAKPKGYALITGGALSADSVVLIGLNGCNNTPGFPSGYWPFDVQCTNGKTYTSASGAFSTSTALSRGSHVCTPDLCDATFQPPLGGGPVICSKSSDGNTAGGNSDICWNYGVLQENGLRCNATTSPPPTTPPPADPQNPPCSGPVCFVPPNKFCAGDLCVIVPNSNSPGDPGPSCGTGGNSALCAGNPPPIPPPPPDGPDNNCQGKSGSWSVGPDGVTTLAFTDCPPPRSSCPAGTTFVNGHCEQSSTCPAGTTKNARGECEQPSVCPAGTSKDSNGNCVAECPAGTTRDATGKCTAGCPAGTIKDATGKCIATCPTGMVLDASQTKCIFSGKCSDGTPVDPTTGQCSANCPAGTIKDANGVCRGQCAPGSMMNAQGFCQGTCGAGLKADPNTGQCVSDNQASGGTDCQAPPVCRGDQALCNIDYQAWAARCAADPGKAAQGDLSDVYKPAGDSVGSVMGKYRAQLESSPLINAANGFFTVNVSGSCPTLTIPPAVFMGHNIWEGLDGNILCEGPLLSIMEMAGYVVLALASFQAFRIAFY